MSWAGWVAMAVVGVLVALRLAPLVLARRAVGHHVPELEPLLSASQRARPRLLVYFWSPGCALCRPMSQAVDALDSDAIVKVNVTEALPLARAFHVLGTPSVAIVENGRIRELLVGARSKEQLESLLNAGPVPRGAS